MHVMPKPVCALWDLCALRRAVPEHSCTPCNDMACTHGWLDVLLLPAAAGTKHDPRRPRLPPQLLKYDGGQAAYPHPFELQVRVAVCDETFLQTLQVKNTGG